VNGLVPFTA
jgi:hypothetical protein